MQYQAAIFDLDGTLVDTLKDIANSANQMLDSYKLPTYSVDEYRYFVGNGSRKLIMRIIPKNKTSDNDFVEEALTRYKNFYETNLLATTKVYDGIIEMLLKFREKNIPLGICTNKHHDAATKIVESIFPKDMFAAIIGDKIGLPRKPDPQKVLQIAHDFGLNPAETLYFGDSGVDMETGVRAGMIPVGVLWGFREREELKDMGARILIKHPMDIFKAVH